MSGMISKTGNIPVVSLNAVALDMEKGSTSASSIELKRTYSGFLKGRALGLDILWLLPLSLP